MEEKRKKILIIGEPMLDKTIFVSKSSNNIRSGVNYKIKSSREFTFGGVFFVSRYLQNFHDVDITVLNICPSIPYTIEPNCKKFFEDFKNFSINDDQKCYCDKIEGSIDNIHSITRFISKDLKNPDKWKIRFQTEDYYAQSNGNIPSKKRYNYNNSSKTTLLKIIKTKIESWLTDNNKYDKCIMLMDYGLGFFDKDLGLLIDLKKYFNNFKSIPIIIYAGIDYEKYADYKNSHIVTYSPDVYDININFNSTYINNQILKKIYCLRSLTFVSGRYTTLCASPSSAMGKNIEHYLNTVETDANDSDDIDQINVPRIGHKALIAAHLAIKLTTEDDNSLLDKRWLEIAHENSKQRARKILTENFVDKDWINNSKDENFKTDIPVQ